MDKLCNMDIKRLYSNFQFSFTCITIIKEDKNASNPIEEFLLNYLEGSQFIVYDFYFNSETPENIDSSLNNLNCIICIEKNCLLIEKVSLSIVNSVIATLKARNATDINTKKRFKNISKTKEEIEANKEIDSFCYHFRTAISSNKFIQTTIRPVVGYIIRRFYCPSTHFKDASFFVFDKVREIKTYEEKMQMADIMCYADSFEKDELICQLMESILNNQKNEKIFL